MHTLQKHGFDWLNKNVLLTLLLCPANHILHYLCGAAFLIWQASSLKQLS